MILLGRDGPGFQVGVHAGFSAESKIGGNIKSNFWVGFRCFKSEPVYNNGVRVSRDSLMIRQLQCRIDESSSAARRPRSSRSGFTLIELLAVIMVILLLAGILINLASYVQKKMQMQIARTQIAVLASALESYKADWGYYPLTDAIRISTSYLAESTNNAYLYNALFSHGKKYLSSFPPSQIQTNQATGLTNIVDVFGIPFNYYNSPGTAFGVSNVMPYFTMNVDSNNGYAVGGQINTATYDLFSYGPDHYTSVPGAISTGGSYPPWKPGAWAWANSANDDITNWRR